MTAPVCPHCGSIMDPIETPIDSSWGGEIHHVCFNDCCGYFQRSWQALENQGIEGVGYRCRINARGRYSPIAITSVDDLKSCIIKETSEQGTLDLFDLTDFARDDETPDSEFYESMGFTVHLDSLAASTVEDLFLRLIPKGSRILDLMAGSDSHLKAELNPTSVTGLGLTREELKANPVLTKTVVHDINANPFLPFEDNEFDAVISTISVDYMTRPVEIFREVARVLRPGGIFIVVFTNRMFPQKAVHIWKASSESERIDLVKKFYSAADRFYLDGYFESKGQPRPVDDKYYDLGIPSDPIYAVWGKVVK